MVVAEWMQPIFAVIEASSVTEHDIFRAAFAHDRQNIGLMVTVERQEEELLRLGSWWLGSKCTK